MKVCLSMWSVHKYWYDGQMSVLDFIDFAQTTGAHGVELLSNFWRDKSYELPQVEQALQQTGLELACFSANNNFVISNEGNRQTQLQDILDSVDVAQHLGARVVRVFSGDPNPDVDTNQAMSWIYDGLSRAAEYAQRAEITLCLENHGKFAGRADQVRNILDQVGSPFLKLTFDTANFLLVGDNPLQAADLLKQDVGHVHAKDFAKASKMESGFAYTGLNGEKYVGRLPGQGDVQLVEVLKTLRQFGYDQWLSVEYEGQDEQKEASVRSVEILKQLAQTL